MPANLDIVSILQCREALLTYTWNTKPSSPTATDKVLHVLTTVIPQQAEIILGQTGLAEWRPPPSRG